MRGSDTRTRLKALAPTLDPNTLITLAEMYDAEVLLGTESENPIAIDKTTRISLEQIRGMLAVFLHIILFLARQGGRRIRLHPSGLELRQAIVLDEPVSMFRFVLVKMTARVESSIDIHPANRSVLFP